MSDRLHVYVVPPLPNRNTPRVAAEYEFPSDVYAEWEALGGPCPPLPEVDEEELGPGWGRPGWGIFQRYRPSDLTSRTHGEVFDCDTAVAGEAMALAWGARLDEEVEQFRSQLAACREARRAEIRRWVAQAGALRIPDDILDW
jgi:hypothetical protein